jgi:hypothetical protein
MRFLYSKRLHEQKTVNSVTNTWSNGVSHEGKYCSKFPNQYSFICSKFYTLYKYNINISHNKTMGLRNSFNNLNVNNMNSVTNTWSIQQTPMFHGCTITNKQNVEPWKLSMSWVRIYADIQGWRTNENMCNKLNS